MAGIAVGLAITAADRHVDRWAKGVGCAADAGRGARVCFSTRAAATAKAGQLKLAVDLADEVLHGEVGTEKMGKREAKQNTGECLG